jgi:putative nucleotidyltransferase with HDIG domain
MALLPSTFAPAPQAAVHLSLMPLSQPGFAWRLLLRTLVFSGLLAAAAAPLAWWVARENAVQLLLEVAEEDSRRVWDAEGGTALQREGAAKALSRSLVGGVFDLAATYDERGRLLAWAVHPHHEHAPQAVRALLRAEIPQWRGDVRRQVETHPTEGWVVRITRPLRGSPQAPDGSAGDKVGGYVEGIAIAPPAQAQKIGRDSLQAAVVVGLAALLCGLGFFPLIRELRLSGHQQASRALDANIAMIESLGRAIAKRDSETGAHNYRVAWIAARVAEHLGMDASRMQSLVAGAFLHDIGKIGIPDAILLKPGRLSDEEMAVMREHVNKGKEIVAGIQGLDGVSDIVAYHHEKWDGSGYPHRLKGEDIPLMARIFAIADVFDALSVRRPYKAPMGFEQVMQVMDEGCGSHFDPTLYQAFREQATDIAQRLQGINEDNARELLSELLGRYFVLHPA